MFYRYYDAGDHGQERGIVIMYIYPSRKPYRTCAFCGSNLDFDESCDCAEKDIIHHDARHNIVKEGRIKKEDGN